MSENIKSVEKNMLNLLIVLLSFILLFVFQNDLGIAHAENLSPDDRVNDIESNRKDLEENGYSILYPENWYPGYQDSEGRFLQDFSYAGYHQGKKTVPSDVPGRVVDVTESPYLADNTGTTDATHAIQTAIDQVGAEGGGVVYLPEGTYKIKPQENNNYALRIKDDGVVLKGAGSEQTYLYNEETFMRAKNVISVRGEGNGWVPYEGSTFITADLLKPTSQIPLSDVSSYEVGDWIVVSSETTTDFIAEHDMTDWWDAIIDNEGPAFYRQIVNIDGEANTINIDIPTRYALKRSDRAKVYKVETPISEIGIEDLSIGNKQHQGSGFGNMDYEVEGTGGYEVHNSYIINLEQVVNSWVKGVSTYKPEVNDDDYHLLSNGIVLTRTRNVSVLETIISNPQYRGAGGNGYLFELVGNDNLIQDSHAEKGRHNYSFKYMHSNGNVIHRSSSTNPSLLIDFHMRLSMSNLLDGMILNNDSIHAGVRSSGSATSRHGMTTSQSVIWNTLGNGHHPSVDGYIIDSRQFGHGYVIGTRGTATKVQTTPVIDSGRDTSPEDFVEGEGQGENLIPQSLYEDQLNKRIAQESVQLNTIKVNNKPIRHFLSGQLEYAVELPNNTNENEIPDVTVRTIDENATVEIVDAQSLPGVTKIIVTGTDGTTSTYKLEFTIAENPAELIELQFVADKSQPGWRAMGNRIETDASAQFRLLGTMSNGDPTDFTEVDDVTYVSSNEAIATINDEGTITALSEGEATISVSVTFNDVTLTESIDIIVVPTFPEPDLPSIPVVEVTASAHDGNVPANTLDSDLDTRWSAEGNGQWIQYNLGESHFVSALNIAFHNGHVRSTIFDIEVSMNGINWSQVYSGQSSGDVSGFEFFNFETVKAQYIRIIGFGNTVNAWNSISETRIHPGDEPIVTLDSIRTSIDDYVDSGELRKPLLSQLTNRLDQAEKHLNKDRTSQAIKHLQNFLKHLNNKPMQKHVSEQAKQTLETNINTLIKSLGKKQD